MDELARRFAEMAERLGPHVVEAARGAARVEGWSTVRSALALFVLAGLLVLFGRFFWRRAEAIREEDSLSAAEFPAGFGYIAFGLAAVLGLGGAWALIDPWTWTAIANPDLWLARRVLKL